MLFRGLSPDIEYKAIECVKKAIEALNLNHGSVNMDILITKEGHIHIVDIGARMGGNMIGPFIVPYGTGIDYVGNMIKAAVGDKTIWIPKKPRAVATKILALTPGTIEKLPEFSKWISSNVRIEHHLHIGDQINEYHTNIDGCGYVIATADSVSEAELIAQQVKTEIDSQIIRKYA